MQIKTKTLQFIESTKKHPIAYMVRMFSLWMTTVAAIIIISFYGFNFETPKFSVEYTKNEAQAAQTEDNLDVLVGTPMEEAIPLIRKAASYYEISEKLFLCVANAESSFKSFPAGSRNPFGIKPSGELRFYSTWEQSINGFAQLIKYGYIEDGLITPEQIMPRYVGYDSQDWIKNCKKFYDPKVVVIIE